MWNLLVINLRIRLLWNVLCGTDTYATHWRHTYSFVFICVWVVCINVYMKHVIRCARDKRVDNGQTGKTLMADDDDDMIDDNDEVEAIMCSDNDDSVCVSGCLCVCLCVSAHQSSRSRLCDYDYAHTRPYESQSLPSPWGYHSNRIIQTHTN